MGSFTTTTSSDEDAAFAAARSAYNAENGTTLTAAQFFDLAIRAEIRKFVETQLARTDANDKTAILNAWRSATTATKNQVRTLLGL